MTKKIDRPIARHNFTRVIIEEPQYRKDLTGNFNFNEIKQATNATVSRNNTANVQGAELEP